MSAARHRRRLPIQEGWSTYSALLPAHAPAAQVRETRRAFYGGALALLEALLKGIPPGQDIVVDKTMTEELRARANRHGDFAEIDAFADDLEAGRA